MSTYTPHYRLTLYKPRSVDSTETAVLVANGTVHSDNFKIITKQGVAGWQPYLDPPKGRKGRIDLLTRKTDVGKLTFQILDKSTVAGANLSRWMSGFLGAGGTTIPGKVQFGGCKCLVEESTDGGTTWTTFFTGRVTGCALNGLVRYSLDVIGLAADLQNAVAFRSRPHSSITYACEPCLAPLGLSKAYGGITPIPSYSGTINSASWYTGQKAVILSNTAAADAYNITTKALLDLAGVAPTAGTAYWQWFSGARARVRLTYSGNTYEYVLLGVRMSGAHSTVAGSRQGVAELAIAALDATAPLYGAIPADTSAVTAVSVRVASNLTTPDRPLFLADVHPVQLLADLLDGKFGALDPIGAVQRTYPRDSTSFTALIADTTFPAVRFRLTDGVKLGDWIAENLLKPFGLAIYENAAGNIVVVDVRPPTSIAGLTTITDADLDASAPPEWGWDRTQSFGIVSVKTYLDRLLQPTDLAAIPGPWPDINTALTAEVQLSALYELGTLLDGDFNERTYTLDVTGMRSTLADNVQARDRATWVAAWANRLALDIAKPYGAGPLVVTVTGRRTANTAAATPGGLVIVDSDQLPDPYTNLRGGAFVGRVLEKTEQGPRVALQVLVLGPSATAGVPTVGTIGAGASGYSDVTAVITLNANSDPVVLRTAVTATSVGTIPVDSSALWTYAGRTTTSTTITLGGHPSGMRVWVQARSEPNPKKADTVAPSAWASSAGTKYNDTTAITAPSSLAATAVTASYAKLTWSIGSVTTYGVRVYLANGASSGAANAATVAKLIDLPPGTTYFDLYGLDAAGPYYKPEVCFYDPFGGESAHAALAATSFQATGTAGVAPQPAAISVYGSIGARAVQASGALDRPNTPPAMGVPLVITPGAPGYGVVVQRAPDSSGSPGTYADLVTLTADAIQDQGFLFGDLTAAGTTIYWYRARGSQPGFTDSGYCTAIASSARPMPTGFNASATIYPVNRAGKFTDALYATTANDTAGKVVSADVVKSDGTASRAIVSGVQSGLVANGGTVTFSPAFQEIPLVILQGGVLVEPRSKWGTTGSGSETNAYDSAKATYENFAALGLSATGFTARARLRQAGTPTARGHDALASALTTVGSTDTTTISNAPSRDDTYQVSFRTQISLTSGVDGSGDPSLVTATLVVNIKSDASGSYVVVDTITHVFSRQATSSATDTQTWTDNLTISGLSSTEHIQITPVSFTTTGVVAASSWGVISLASGQEITYTTATDSFASKTPDSSDMVAWTAWGKQ